MIPLDHSWRFSVDLWLPFLKVFETFLIQLSFPSVLLKGEGYSKSLLCLSSPIAGNHSAFLFTEVPACKVPAILKNFVSKAEVTSEAAIFKLSWQPDRFYETSSRPTRNWRERQKPATGLASFTRSAKSFLFQAIIYFIIFNAIILEFEACLAHNNMAKEQP